VYERQPPAHPLGTLGGPREARLPALRGELDSDQDRLEEPAWHVFSPPAGDREEF
jgi:hypothetical protein